MIIVTDMLRETMNINDIAAASAYSQVNNGFCPRELERMAAEAGLEVSLCDITSRERNAPYFEVVSLYARKPGGALRVVAS